MKPFLYSSLISNAASLGVHWIYNHEKLKQIQESKSLLFLSQDEAFFNDAKPSFYVYPKNEIGQLSVQGQILTWLYKALKENPKFSKTDYENLLFEKFKPGGDYQGYVESYAKKLVISKLSDELKLNFYKHELNDTHLVGFMPYLASKALEIDLSVPMSLLEVFTLNKDYKDYIKMFDQLFINLELKDMKSAILDIIKYAPNHEKAKFENIKEISNIDDYINAYAGRACSIEQSIPLIFYILYHAKDFEDALNINVSVGGASSDRALLLGAFLEQLYEIPNSWKEKVKKHLKEADYL